MSILGLNSGYTVKYTLCLQEFPRASPLGTPSDKGLHFTVYPSSRPNTDTVYNFQADIRPGCAGEPADHPDGDAEELPHQHLPGQPRLHRPTPHTHLHPGQGDKLFWRSFNHFLKYHLTY